MLLNILFGSVDLLEFILYQISKVAIYLESIIGLNNELIFMEIMQNQYKIPKSLIYRI